MHFKLKFQKGWCKCFGTENSMFVYVSYKYEEMFLIFNKTPDPE